VDHNSDGVPDALDNNDDGIPSDPDLDGNGSTDATSPLRALTAMEYDEQGRGFRSTTYNVNQNSGEYSTASTSTIVSEMWFDHRGNVVKSHATEQASHKMQYDGAGRLTKSFVIADTDDTTWADAMSINGDTVLQQMESLYDANSNLVLSITRTRFDGVDGTGSLLLPTSSANNARVTYMLNFYDAADRLTATVDLGTNGGVLHGGSAGLDLDPNTNGIIDIPASAPTASTSTVLMTSYSYNSAGYLSVIADPRGIKSKTFYDSLGRTTYSVQNWTGGYDPTGNTLPSDSTHHDENQTVAYVYGSNSHMTAMTLLLPSGTPSQTTEYVYGVTTGQGSTINSNDLLRLIKHPRRVGTDAGEASELTGDQESFTYDALGETLTHTLQNGLKHTYGYDILGRTISDNSSGGTIDQTVTYAYDIFGNVTAVTDARGNTTTRIYDGFGRLARIIQPIPDDAGPQDHPTTYFFYDKGGNIAFTVDPNLNLTVKGYDFLHRLIISVDGDPWGDVTLDAVVDNIDYATMAGNWGRTDAAGPWEGDVTLDGRVDGDDYAVVAGNFGMTGSMTFYRYLVDGEKITVTAPNGNAPGATAAHYTTTTVLDRFGRTAQFIQPSPDGVAAAPTTSYTYDNNGNVLTITDPRGNVAGATASHHTTTFTYDGLNRKLTQTSPVPNLDGTGTPSVTSWERDLLGNLTTMTDPNGNETTYTYDSRNFLFETIHPAANTSSGPISTYTIYDNDGNLIASMDGNGANNAILTVYAYDLLNRLILKIDGDPYGDVDFDGDVDSADVTFVANHTGQSVAVPFTFGDLDFDGKVDIGDINSALGQLGATGGAITTYTYDANGNLLTIVDPLGHVAGATASHHTTSYEYDRLNRRLSMTAPDPDGASSLTAPVTTWTYDAVGNVLTVTTPRGNEAGAAANSFITTYAYDAQNRLISITGPDPDGTGSQYAAITTYSYDANGNKIAMVDPLGNAPGATASHHTTVYAYDRLNRLVSVTEPDPGDSSGHPVTRYGYDANGNLTSVTNALNQTTSYLYDNLNRKIQMNAPDPDGIGGVGVPVTTYGYDLNGNMTSMVDPLGNAAGATASHHTTLYAYDNLNRRFRVTLPDPDGTGGDAAPVTSYTFDNNGNVLTITDPIGNVTTYTYDSFNRVLTDTNDTGHARTYEYDLNGNMIEAVDRNGRVRTFTYDNLNRMTRESWRSGSSEVGSIASTFYSDGSLESTESGEFSGGSMTLTSQQSFTYDGAGRLTSSWLVNDAISSGSFSLNSSYDVAGRRTGLDLLFAATLDFSNSYAYDNLNRLAILTQSGPGGSGFAVDDKRVDFFYDKLGQNTGTTRYNSLTNSTTNIVAGTLLGYNYNGRPTSQEHWTASEENASFYQSYDIAGRLIEFADNDDHSSSFTYDHNGQLLTVTNTGGYGGGIMPEENFDFDANGNRGGAGYATGSDNQMTRAPSLADTSNHYEYTYDFEGNLTGRTLRNGTNGALEHLHFIWDYRNRLKEVQTYGPIPLALPAKAFYYYNAFDQRIGKLVDSNGDSAVDLTENFIYDGTNLILVTDGGSDPQQRYLTGLKTNEIFAEESSQATPGSTRWALTDHLGTVRAIADHDGNLVNVTTYRAFGEVVSHSAPGQAIRMGWTGYVYDAETKLNNAWHRYYDPRGGRFISVDPMGFGAGDTNLYRYVTNNALGSTDPTGLWEVQGLFNEFFEQYGEGAAGALLWAAKGHVTGVKKVSCQTYEWQFDSKTPTIVNILSESHGMVVEPGFIQGSEITNQQAARALMAAIQQRRKDDVLDLEEAANYQAAAGRGWYLYYKVGQTIGFSYAAEAIQGADSMGNKMTSFERVLSFTLGTVQTALFAAPVAGGIVKLGAGAISAETVAQFAKTGIGKIALADLTPAVIKAATNAIQSAFIEVLESSISRTFGPEALKALKNSLKSGKLSFLTKDIRIPNTFAQGAGTKLTGFSQAESSMVQKSLKALKDAGYDTSLLKEVIRADMPPGYRAMSLDNGAALGNEAFGSQAALNSAMEEELIHLQQRAVGLGQSFGPGTAQSLEEAANAARKFPIPQ
jgi:RHS repeat-associated protein